MIAMAGYKVNVNCILTMIVVMSLNCTGLDRSLEYIRDVLEESKPHIMCLQETWHLSRNYSKLNNIHDDYMWTSTVLGMAAIFNTCRTFEDNNTTFTTSFVIL